MQHKAMLWTGWILTGLVGVFFLFAAYMAMTSGPEMSKEFTEKLGWPHELSSKIGIVALVCAVLFVIPRTAVLGAVLLTGYLGGAIATHVRVHDNFAPAAVAGVVVWLALFLRDERIRALLPICTKAKKR